MTTTSPIGLRLASLPAPFIRIFTIFRKHGDARSFLCFFTFCIVILILAYLTNPSETTFRAYLTEKSFRQHLNRLNDNPEDDYLYLEGSKSSTVSTSTLSFSHPVYLSFSSRASVSLRTPKHVFHNLGLLTIATMVPMVKSVHSEDGTDVPLIANLWYIGAFGRWWQGRTIETWCHDAIAKSKYEESRNLGILGMRSVNLHRGSIGFPLSSTSSKIQSHEGVSQGLIDLPIRSFSPPPLPKSASLPLHSVQSLPIIVDQPAAFSYPPQLESSRGERINAAISTPIVHLADHSPLLSDLLRQISVSKCSVIDLRSQLSDFQLKGSQSRKLLQSQVDLRRERKRQEDAVRSELKTRIKSLDEVKRQAEGLKRELEKKYKAAQTVRNSMERATAFLDERLANLCQHIIIHRTISAQSGHSSETVSSLKDDIEYRKQEIQAAETQISSLNQCVRRLEDDLVTERKRLEAIRNRLDVRKLNVPSWVSVSPLYDTQIQPALLKTVDCTITDSLDQTPNRQLTIPNLSTSTTESSSQPFDLLHANDDVAQLNDLMPVTYSSSGSPIAKQQSKLPWADVEALQQSLPGSALRRTFTDCSAHMSSTVHQPPRSGTAISRQYYDVSIQEQDASTTGPLRIVQYPDRSINSNAKICTLESAPGCFPQHQLLSHDISYLDIVNELLDPTHKVDGSSGSMAANHSVHISPFPSGVAPPASTSSNALLRAFAPSPAERRVLQRALGGTSNSNLDRLPSLGDVGKMGGSRTCSSPQEVPCVLPSWFLTSYHEVSFSPWEDEEMEEPTSGILG
ncbi:hypothetical protein AMATHDRAFT_7609 [Amanita thiersii Skay4041]|uniref:Uncharacterized protein n=1 Tax=Amanita thiersii Skay4041 TaxID=703135 RepID=A0A2A9N8E5_9AGAR|nr:hypothetical protein AMATHDRAFT_7609 [Amanita thiersii Skay4041]